MDMFVQLYPYTMDMLVLTIIPTHYGYACTTNHHDSWAIISHTHTMDMFVYSYSYTMDMLVHSYLHTMNMFVQSYPHT